MTKEELQRALECAERCRDIDGMYWWGDVVDFLKATLEAKDEKPLCYAAMFDKWFLAKSGLDPNTPLYTTPPQRTWVGLTDIDYAGLPLEQVGLVRWAEAKLKEKNT